MKQLATLAALLFLLVKCTAPAPPPARPAFDLAAIKAHIHAANLEYGDRFQKGDSLWYAERYTRDACMMPPGDAPSCGVGNIARAYFQDGQGKDWGMKIVGTEVTGGPESVVEEGVYEITDPAGKSVDKGKFIAIWKEEDGRWKICREIWNSTPEAKAKQ